MRSSQLMRLVAAGAALCAAPAALAQAQAQTSGEWSAGAGIEYTSGDYGTSTTTKILAIPFLLRYDTEPWTVKFSLPLYRISGARSVVPGFGAVDRGNSRRRDTTETGLGDLTTTFTHHTYYDRASEFGFDLTGKLKLPTGEEDKGLSTGSTDLTFMFEPYKRFGRLTAFGGLGFTSMFGGYLDLRNTFNYAIGASHKLDQGDSLALAIEGRTAPARGVPAQRELIGSWSRVVDKRLRVQAYGLIGLANGSPDWGIGGSLLHAF